MKPEDAGDAPKLQIHLSTALHNTELHKEMNSAIQSPNGSLLSIIKWSAIM